LATSGCGLAENCRDRLLPVLRLAEQLGDGGGGDEEREKGEQGQIGEIAGVYEAVVVDADGDALDDFPGGRRLVDFFRDVVAEGGGFRGELLAPLFW
jgi:hypothetical protein